MGRIEGAKDFTDFERELLISLVSDYMIFRVKPFEILELIKKRTGYG